MTPTEETCAGVQPSAEPCDQPYYMPPLPGLPCPSRADVEAIQRDIPITVKSDASAGIFACREEDGSANLTPVQLGIYQALLFLRRVRFDAPLPWTQKPIYDWLVSTIPRGIEIDSSGDSRSCRSCPGPVTIVADPGDWSHFDRSLTSVPYEVIVHEARHAEGWPHTCRDSNGRLTKDRTIAELGAFGVQYYLNYWLGYHSDQDIDFRMYSRGRANVLRESGAGFCCECRSAAAGSTVALGGLSLFMEAPVDSRNRGLR